jgi:hypothetical protein
MRFFALALVCGIGLGYARRGSLRGLANVPARLFLVLWAALTLQLTLARVPADDAGVPLRLVLVLVSYALAGAGLGWYAARSRGQLPGLSLLALGWFLNVLVITANAGMPVSRHAVLRSGLEWTDVREGSLFKHVPAGSHTSLRFLGDVIPVPGLHRVVSLGDIVLLLGIVSFVAQAMSAPRTRVLARAAQQP